MFRFFPPAFTVIWGLAVACESAPAREPNTPPLADNGEVEVITLQLNRERRADQAPGAELSSLRIELWFKGALPGDKLSRNLVKLVELAPIEDDTGKILSTSARLADIDSLQRLVPCYGNKQARGELGPVLPLTVDAPAREAKSIKSLKGKVLIWTAHEVRLKFEKPGAVRDLPLVHEKLADFPIRATIRVVNGKTKASLAMSNQDERITDWWLVGSDEGQVNAIAEGGDEASSTKVHEGDHSDAALLVIGLLEPTATKVLEFEFKDLELP
jgi:hypothetical protein